MINMIFFVVSLLILIGSLVIQFRIRREKKLIESVVSSKMAKLNHRLAEVNETAYWLEEQIQKLFKNKNRIDSACNDVIQKKIQVDSINKENVILMEQNRDLMKQNKHQLFYVQEAALLVYNHYKKVSEILGKFIDSEPNYEELFATLNTSNNNLMFMSNYFQRYFGMTPEQYTEQQFNLSGQKPNGETYMSNFSKN